jgi:hypothetical protein
VSATVTLKPWESGDLPLLERLMGDPRMTAHLGGPESPDKLRERQGHGATRHHSLKAPIKAITTPAVRRMTLLFPAPQHSVVHDQREGAWQISSMR